MWGILSTLQRVYGVLTELQPLHPVTQEITDEEHTTVYTLEHKARFRFCDVLPMSPEKTFALAKDLYANMVEQEAIALARVDKIVTATVGYQCRLVQ